MRTSKTSLCIGVGFITSMASTTALFAAGSTSQVPGILSSTIRAAASDPVNPKASAKVVKASEPKAKTSKVSFKTVKLIPVAVVSSSQLSEDSIAAIIQRDLVYGDKISRVNVSGMGSANGIVNFASLQPAAFAVHLALAANGLNVELYDVVSRAVQRAGHFVLPVVPSLREAEIRDSVAQALSLKAADTRAALAKNTTLRESVYAALWTPRPTINKKNAKKADEIVMAWIKDSVANAEQLNVLTAKATALMVSAREDTVEANAAIPQLLARDVFVRDSLQGEVRWAIHGIADEIHEWITGERGVAQSRIAYIHDGLVRVVDFDGANDRPVTRNGRALSPAWHPDGHAIVFSDMNNSGMQIAEVKLHSGDIRYFNATPRGLNITPVYTRDGKGIIYAHNRGGENTDLVMMDRANPTQPRWIAPSKYDNLAPCFNPDGTRVAFISSRPKTPQVYSMNLDGTDEQLETPFAAGKRSYRAGPDWSPDGRMIAYEQQNGDFQVWSIEIATKRIRQLTHVGENEDPTWAPNARHMALTSTRGGSKVLWILDTESGRYRQLTKVPGARLAAWSPMLAKGR